MLKVTRWITTFRSSRIHWWVAGLHEKEQNQCPDSGQTPQSLCAHKAAPFESIPFDDRAVDYYGSIRTLLSQAGTIIGGNDLLVAAIALANDLTVVTRNQKEFARVTGLKWVAS